MTAERIKETQKEIRYIQKWIKELKKQNDELYEFFVALHPAFAFSESRKAQKRNMEALYKESLSMYEKELAELTSLLAKES